VSKTVAILGGTGAEGFGLALRWTQAGVPVVIGSRDAEKASAAAERVRHAVPEALVHGLLNPEAAAQADVVVLTVPLVAQIPTVKAVRERLRPGTIFVDTTVPLGAALGDRIARVVTPWAGSAAQQAAAYLPPNVAAVSAFHCLSAVALADLAHPVDCDVLICGDSPEAKAVVKELVEKIPGARAVDAGPLENSRLVEHVAALLVALNVRHKVKHSGLRITGIPATAAAGAAPGKDE
jgi:hypothetical protein